MSADPAGGRTARRTGLVLFGTAVLLAILGVLLAGLPGAVLLMAAEPLAHLFADARIDGDAVWPAAILLGLLGPFTMPAAYLGVVRLGVPVRARAAATACLSGLACLGMATAAQVWGAR